MIFSRLHLEQCRETILAHGVRLDSGALKKGQLLTAADIERLRAAGYESLMVARLEPGDIGEDQAAGRIAQGLTGPGLDAERPATGRCNLKAAAHGLLLVNRTSLERINLMNESIAIATLDDNSIVNAGQLAATVKIIPFAITEELLRAGEKTLREYPPVLELFPFRARQAGFIQSRVPGMQDSVLDKTTRVLDNRLQQLHSRLVDETRCHHEEQELSNAISAQLRSGVDLVIVAGASATVDRNDVVPRAIEQAGGEIIHLGMPVDPGNLLLLARYRQQAIIGMPGCARSPSLNGFDWVLQRLVAGVPVAREDIIRMGCGGLLKEVGARQRGMRKAPAD